MFFKGTYHNGTATLLMMYPDKRYALGKLDENFQKDEKKKKSWIGGIVVMFQ